MASQQCPCGFFDWDGVFDDLVQMCECGHADDEHSQDGECQAEIEVDP